MKDEVEVTNESNGLSLWVGCVAVVLGCAALVAIGLRSARAHVDEARAAADAERARGTRVVVTRVQPAPSSRPLTVTCDVRPYRKVQLFPKLNGYLQSMHVERGQTVRKGQLLAVLEARDAEEQLRAAKLDYRVKSRLLARSQRLDKGLVAPQDLERVQSDSDIASSEVARLEALHAYQFLRAPFDGVVVGRWADVGALVVVPAAMDGSTPILEIWDTSRLRVEGRVGQAEAASVHAGDAVTLWSDERPDQKLAAKIARTTAAVDAQTRTMAFEVELRDCPCGLVPGSFAHARLSIAAAPALQVSIDAVTSRRGETSLLVVDGGRGTFHKVELGDTDGRTVRVLSGVHAGDLVALFPGDALADGAALRPVLP